MRIITVGDPHFKIDNIQEVELFIEKMEELAIKSKPDIIIILGDLLHTFERLHTTPLNKAYEFIEKMRKITLTYVLVGNHDYIQNQQYLTQNHWMNGMKEWDDVVIVDKVLSYRKDGVSLFFCPYVPPGRFEEALNTFENDSWKEATIIFAHQEFFGCKMGAIISVEGDKWPLDYPYIISGHIHSKQTPQPNIYYTGSAMQHAFGESEKNIIAIIDIEDGIRTTTEVDLHLPRKKIVYMDMDKMDTFVPVESKDDVKITLSGSYDDFKAFKKTEKFKSLSQTRTKLVFKIKKTDKVEKEQTEECDFLRILNNLISVEEMEFYELVINNNDVLIL